MKYIFSRIIILTLLLVFLPGALCALDATILINGGNLGFKTDRKQTNTDYDGMKPLFDGSIAFEQKFSEDMGLSLTFSRDPILRNVSSTTFYYQNPFFTVGAGPFFGFFNSTSTLLKSGISTQVKIQYPGLAYLQFMTDSSIGGRLVETGDYLQEQSKISFGFYVPHAICSLNIHTKKFTQKLSDKEVVDSLTRYTFDSDLFQKYIPYRILLSFGFQRLDKRYIADSTVKHTLNTIVVGTELHVDIAHYGEAIFDIDSSVYTFGQNELLGITNPGPFEYLFKATLGVSLKTDKLLQQ